jgi:hypothetical protein
LVAYSVMISVFWSLTSMLLPLHDDADSARGPRLAV